MVPTRRFVILLTLVAVALVAYQGQLVGGIWGSLGVVNGALAVVGLADWALAPRAGRFTIRRELAPVLVTGTTGELTWVVTSSSRRGAVVAVADHLAPSLGAGRRRFRVRLPAGATARSSTTLTPRRRGRFDLEDVSLRVEGPLGLMARQSSVRVPGLLRVHPPFRSRNEAELRIRRARMLAVGLRTIRGGGGGTEFEQLREYSTDDEFRRVDWSASARAGKPIVRTYRPERNQTVMILIDNGRLGAATVGGAPRVEHALDAAIMLTAVASRLGDKVGAVAFDATVRAIVSPAGRRDQVGRLTEAMYALEPALVESDYAGAISETLRRFRRRSLLVLLSDLNEQAMTDALEPSLPLVLRRHMVVVAAVRDPDVERWASVTPRDEEDAYLKASAIAALAQRDRVAARLRGMGVEVVDAAPSRLAPQLADVYLRIKGTGRL